MIYVGIYAAMALVLYPVFAHWAKRHWQPDDRAWDRMGRMADASGGIVAEKRTRTLVGVFLSVAWPVFLPLYLWWLGGKLLERTRG